MPQIENPDDLQLVCESSFFVRAETGPVMPEQL